MSEDFTPPAVQTDLDVPGFDQSTAEVARSLLGTSQANADIGHETSLTHQALKATLDRFSYISEVSERHEELLHAGQRLVDAYGIRPDFFDEHKRSMLFLSLAGNASRLKEGVTDSDAEQSDQRTFIELATFLLTRKHSDGNDELKANYESQERDGIADISDESTLAVYDKYTDQELTKAVEAKVEAEGIFIRVLDRLGISQEKSKKVLVRVLNIGNGVDYGNFDYKSQGMEWRELNEWSEGLKKRAQDFAEELQNPDAKMASQAAGFATSLGGQEFIFIPMRAAEYLLSEERGINTDNDKGTLRRMIGTLEHEFTHNQESERVEKVFGYAVEEMRAEHFSDNTSEYYDVKGFFNNLAVLSGTRISAMFDTQAEGRRVGQEKGLYDQVAEVYGLDMAVLIAAVMPAPYIPHIKNEFVKGMVTATGGFDGVVARYGKTLSDEQKQKAKKKLEEILEGAKARGHEDHSKDMLAPSMQILGYQ